MKNYKFVKFCNSYSLTMKKHEKAYFDQHAQHPNAGRNIHRPAIIKRLLASISHSQIDCYHVVSIIRVFADALSHHVINNTSGSQPLLRGSQVLLQKINFFLVEVAFSFKSWAISYGNCSPMSQRLGATELHKCNL